MNRITKISQELKLEITKRDMIISDKNADLNRQKDAIYEQVDILKHQLKVNVEKEALVSFN